MLSARELIETVERVSEFGYPTNESDLELLHSDLLYVEALCAALTEAEDWRMDLQNAYEELK